MDPTSASRLGRAIARLKSDWDHLARDDAMYAVFSDPSKRGGGWDHEAFYAHGRAAVDRMLQIIDELGVECRTGAALDFGCGAGRITFALADHFTLVTGVDVSPAMLEAARVAGVPPNCELVLQSDPELPDIRRGGYDLIVSMLVLQHMRPRLMRAYLDTIPRLLAPGGVLFLQVPHGFARETGAAPRNRMRALARRCAPRPLVDARRWIGLRRSERAARRHGAPVHELHRLPIRTVRRILDRAGLRTVVFSRDDPGTAPPLASAWYLATRPASVPGTPDQPS